MSGGTGRAPDLEDLAAYLDGRLHGQRRAQVERSLAADEERFEVFAEAARFRAAKGRAEPGVIRRTERVRRRAWVVVGSLAAAACLAVAVSLRLAGGAFNAEALASSLVAGAPPETRLGAQWDDPGWSRTRGAAAARDGLTAEQIAFRLGARSVDVQVALRGDDRATARRVVTEVIDLAQSVAGPLAVSAYEGLRGRLASDEPPESLRQRAAAAGEHLAELFPGEPASLRFRLGEWSELGRLAARAADAELLRSRRFRSFLEETRRAELDPEAVQVLAGFEEWLRQPESPAGSVEMAFSTLIWRLAG